VSTIICIFRHRHRDCRHHPVTTTQFRDARSMVERAFTRGGLAFRAAWRARIESREMNSRRSR
jgi:hypothetical protein